MSLSRKAELPRKATTKETGKERLLQCCHLLLEEERAALSNYHALSAFQCLIIAQRRSIKLYYWELDDVKKTVFSNVRKMVFFFVSITF